MRIHNVGGAQLLLSCGCLKVKDSCECILNGSIWDYGLAKRNGVLMGESFLKFIQGRKGRPK